MNNICVIGGGNWGSKVTDRLKKNGLSTTNISFKDFNGIPKMERNEIAKSSLIWICSTPLNQIELINTLSHKKYRIVLEKPLIRNSLDFKKLQKVINSNQSTFFISQIWTFSDFWKQAKNVLTSLGEISEIEIIRSGPSNRVHFSAPIDWIPHDLYLLFDLYGYERMINMLIKKRITVSKNLERTEINLNNGIEVTITTGENLNRKMSTWEVSNSLDRVKLDFIQSEISVSRNNGSYTRIKVPSTKENIQLFIQEIIKKKIGDNILNHAKVLNHYLSWTEEVVCP